MMKQATIMTTNIRKIVSPDLFVENDSILFDRRRAAEFVENIRFLGPSHLSLLIWPLNRLKGVPLPAGVRQCRQ